MLNDSAAGSTPVLKDQLQESSFPAPLSPVKSTLSLNFNKGH